MENNTSTATPSSSSSEQCESGWTLYLDHSTQFHTANQTINAAAKSPCNRRQNTPCCELHRDSFYNDHDDDDDEEEEEGLSMVSDASSGPPHFEEEEAGDVCCYDGGGRKRGTSESSGNVDVNVKLGRRRFDRDDFALDDTASSHPIMNMIFSSKKNGGVHCAENQDSPIKSLMDYSSQGFSATHFQCR